MLDGLLALKTLNGVPHVRAVRAVGRLVDLSKTFGSIAGVKTALGWHAELELVPLDDRLRAILEYNCANAWAVQRDLTHDAGHAAEWTREELGKEMLHLRKARNGPGFAKLAVYRRQRILTNLANIHDRVGRFVEAKECYDAALAVSPGFAMALGNRGVCELWYARAINDPLGQTALVQSAHGDLSAALDGRPLEPHAVKPFRDALSWIEGNMKKGALELRLDLDRPTLGRSQAEVNYRRWALSERLFLNPLNDISPSPAAASDSLILPGIVVPLAHGPYYVGFFNQMKQEFASARFLLYDGLHSGSPHYSDRRVRLFNTLDYPTYCLATEKAKASFRSSYALLDKVAFFLNTYFDLDIPEKNIYLSSVWFDESRGIRKAFADSANWPLRGLFWLSRDLYTKDEEHLRALDPEAASIKAIRDHLEHKYLKLHESEWGGPPQVDDWTAKAMADTLAYSVYRRDFEAKALKLLKVVRAALVYLAASVTVEERRRAHSRPPDKRIGSLVMDVWEDRWKR